jgi:hypothetical protein
MKARILTVFILLSTITGFSQGDQNFSIVGGFGGPMFSTTKIDQGTSLIIGGGGAAVFSNNLFIGGFGVGTSDMIANNATIPDYKDYAIQREYGGPWVGYIFRANKRMYLTGSLKAGFGDIWLNNKKENHIIYDDITVFTPQITIDYRLLNVVYLSVGASYDQFINTGLLNYNEKDFNKIKLNFSIKFGYY